MSASGCNAIEKSASLKKQCSGHALNIIDNGKRATLGRTQECRVQSAERNYSTAMGDDED